MDKVDTNEVRKLMNEVTTTMSKVDCLRSEVGYATGEVKDAYTLILNSHLWTLQKKIGQLWYYVCGTPLVPIEETISSD